jgi:hypothetical protein
MLEQKAGKRSIRQRTMASVPKWAALGVAVLLVLVAGCSSSPTNLTSIAVTPATASIAVGGTQQFTATGTYSNGSTQNLTSLATWTSSSTAAATITSGGLATGVAAGTSTISASFGAIVGTVTGTATLTVTGPSLTSIAVTPTTASIAIGGTQQYTATGTYSDGTTAVLTTETWASSTPTVATISTTGLATGVASGATTITATCGTVTSPGVTLTVTATLLSIAVTPTNASIAVGGTQQFTATGTYSDGTTQNLNASATWTSNNATVATITSPGGLATGLASGTTVISAACGTVTSPGVTLTVAGTGQGSNGTLDGQYVFSLTGTNENGNYGLVGSLTADGNGNITAGEVNFGDPVNKTYDATITGTYAIGTNGTGTLTLTTGDTTFGLNGVSAFVLSMVTPNGGALAQTGDSDALSGQGAGRLSIQTPADFNASFITGGYAFTFAGTGTGGTLLNTGGVLTADGVGSFSSITEDIVSNYVVSTDTPTGTFTGPDTNGLGTATFTSTSGTTTTFAYYLISGSALRLIETDTTSGDFQLGSLMTQGPSPVFTDASLTGSYAFSGNGTASDSTFSTVIGGLLTADGAGNITSGILDSDDNGTVVGDTSFTGTYTVASNGRGTITNTVGTTTMQLAAYFTSNSVLFLEIDGTVQLGGRLLLQTGAGSFTAASLSGNYAASYHTVPVGSFVITDTIGQVTSDGVSALTGIVCIESAASSQPGVALTGNYTSDPSGRFTGTITTNGTNLAVSIYLINTDEALFISQDPSAVGSGVLQLQQLTTPEARGQSKPTRAAGSNTAPIF